jgi:signal peptidase II
VTDSISETPAVEGESPLAASPTPDSPAPAPIPAPPATELAVEGARLGVPFGSTRHVWEPNLTRPSYFFLVMVSLVSLVADIVTKLWAEKQLKWGPGVEVWKGHVALIHAENRGGAWGLLQSTSESVRRPFFLLVSVAAIAFIMTLYRRLQPRQRALRWGLPLVLGGALGNVFDRVRLGHVIDFIDVHVFWAGTDHHWPTFNVADVAICLGVGLMAVDMFTAKKVRAFDMARSPIVPPAQSGEPAVDDIRSATPAPVPAAPVEAPPPAEPPADAPPPDAPVTDAPTT